MQKKKDRKSKRTTMVWLVAGIIVVILLLLRSCRQTPPQQSAGDFDISDVPRQTAAPPDKVTEIPTITFEGKLRYEITSSAPEIELKNPKENSVDFIFTLLDEKSGELIVRTDKVAAGKYVYVNVADFYSEPGVYPVTLNIATYDVQTGEQKNGLNQTVEIVVVS